MYYCCQSFGHNVTFFEALGLWVSGMVGAEIGPAIPSWTRPGFVQRFESGIKSSILEIDMKGSHLFGVYIQMGTRRLWFKKLVENSHMLVAGIWCPNMPWHLFRGIDHLRCTSFWKQISLECGNKTDEWMFATGKILTGPWVRTATEKGTGSSPVFYISDCAGLSNEDLYIY